MRKPRSPSKASVKRAADSAEGKAWLPDILQKGNWLKAREAGSSLPQDPTLDDFKKEAYLIAQRVKELHNSNPFPQKNWEKISQAIEKLEKLYGQK